MAKAKTKKTDEVEETPEIPEAMEVKETEFEDNEGTYPFKKICYQSTEVASSAVEVMEVPNGCVIQTSTISKLGSSQALVFVPGVKPVENGDGTVKIKRL